MDDALSNAKDIPCYQKNCNIGASEMPLVKYIFTAGRSIQDRVTSKWSYIDVANVFVIPKSLGQFIASFVISGRLSGVTAGMTNLIVYIMGPDNKIFHQVTLSGQLQNGDVDFNANVPFVTFTKAGRYFIHVSYNGEIISGTGQAYIDVFNEQ